jgi:hypothetical protein
VPFCALARVSLSIRCSVLHTTVYPYYDCAMDPIKWGQHHHGAIGEFQNESRHPPTDFKTNTASVPTA